jgi:hypothetical protein
MATVRDTLTATGQAVASGAGEAFVTFNDAQGFWCLHTSSDGSALTDWHPWPKGLTLQVSMSAGDFLILRGRGTAVVTAGTTI